MCVPENYKVHYDSFELGVRKTGLLRTYMLTSYFQVGYVIFNGITCFGSFRRKVKEWGLDYSLLKKFCNHKGFRNQIFAMFQCKKCFPVLRRFLSKMLQDHDARLSDFDKFLSRVHHNSKKKIKKVNMEYSFCMKDFIPLKKYSKCLICEMGSWCMIVILIFLI